jgi:hypothetical protein
MSQAQSKGALIGFWITTGIICLTQFGSGIGDLVGAEGLVEGVTNLHYPAYILYILGPLKILGVLTLAAPRLTRLKEWAYAGFFFDFTGAAASHTLNGDSIAQIAPAAVFIVILLVSYFLRPASRKLAGPIV